MAKICVSQNQALEERLSNMHDQMAGVTSRLVQTERDLDLERVTRDDIIKAEVAKQVAEEKARIRAEVEAEYAEERAAIEKDRLSIEKQKEDMQRSFEQMQQKLIEENATPLFHCIVYRSTM